MNCDEPHSPTNCHPFLFFRCLTSYHKPSAVCLLWLIFVCIQLSLWKTSGEEKNKLFIEQGRFTLTNVLHMISSWPVVASKLSLMIPNNLLYIWSYPWQQDVRYMFVRGWQNLYAHIITTRGTLLVVQLVEALRYKSEGRWFDSRWCHWNFSLT